MSTTDTTLPPPGECGPTGEVSEDGVPIIVCNDLGMVREPEPEEAAQVTTATVADSLPVTGVDVPMPVPLGMLAVGVVLVALTHRRPRRRSASSRT